MKATLSLAVAIALAASAFALNGDDDQNNPGADNDSPNVVKEHEYRPEVQLQLELLQNRFDALSQSQPGNAALLSEAENNLDEMKRYFKTLGENRDDTTDKAGEAKEQRHGVPMPEGYLRLMKPFLMESVKGGFAPLGVNPSAPNFNSWPSDAATTAQGWEAQEFQLRGFASALRDTHDPETKKQMRESLRQNVRVMVESRDAQVDSRIKQLESELQQLRGQHGRRETADEVFERLTTED